jgi:hypothetical protein
MTANSYLGPRLVVTPNVGNAVAVQVAVPNPSRTNLYVFNPGVNVIWVAPVLDATGPGNPTVAVAGGNGSVPIQPLQGFMFPGFTNGMSAIASAGATNILTVWEYYQ